MEFPSLIIWTSPFPILGVLGVIFIFFLNFNSKSEKCGRQCLSMCHKKGIRLKCVKPIVFHFRLQCFLSHFARQGFLNCRDY